ncbi:MAG TPA: beta-L-arabinofuranosidase domain-containing protein [Jiangellaceae bacterium]|nr:beta-L-arabinofuranosidase domain-containing protein [Jiangellaceae bacterium]
MTVPVVPSSGRLRPLGLGDVRITGGFWAQRQRINGSASIEHALSWAERVGWIDNLRAAADGRLSDVRRGREFSDSDVYKLLEAMAWESARGGRTMDDAAELVAITAGAQDADGYLNTAFGRPGQPARYSDLEWGHELYCYGHLFHAAVAHSRAGGDGLLDVAVRAADHVCRTFGPDGNDGICGHAGVEMALVELARLTGEQRYVDQAAEFVGRRGLGRLADIELGRAYYQDDVPVRDATVLRGHAVRALYLAAGAVDVAVETGDQALLEAVIAQWEAAVARRTYITGGMGARHTGEAFGDDFALPPDRSYSETCAGVASVMLSWRLLLATGDPQFADLAERTLFNVVATSPAEDGRAFFYANTLHQRSRDAVPGPSTPNPRPTGSIRSPWFAVSCCPTNVARLLASLAGYLATTDGNGLQIHQYADAEITTTLDGGHPIALSLRTEYPNSGVVTAEVTQAPNVPVTLSFRIPPWGRAGATVIEPDGGTRAASGASTIEVRRRFTTGEKVRLELPIEPRWTAADPRIDAVRGTVAVERGPLVLCAESTDLPGDADVDAVQVDTRKAPAVHDGRVIVQGSLVKADDATWPYQDSGTRPASSRQDAGISLLPYHAWANRGPSTMRVWLPVQD